MIWISALRVLAAVVFLAGGAFVVATLSSVEERDPPLAATIDTLEQHVAENPDDAESFALLGKLHLIRAQATGDLEGYRLAEKRLRRALEETTPTPRLRGTLAEILLGQHRHREALALAEEVRREDPRDLRALTVIGDAQRELGRTDESEKAFEELRAIRPVPAILARLARLAEIRGDGERANRLLEEALATVTRESRDPADASWYLAKLCALHLARGAREQASPLCEKARSLREDDLTLRTLAELRSAEERYAEAIALYEAANRRHPDPGLHDALADLYEATGESALAEQHAAAAIKLAEQSPFPGVHFRLLSSIYANREGGAARALELANAALAEGPDVYAWDALAFALWKNGRLREADEASAKALALQTPEPVFHYHAGLIRHGLGDDATARAHLERALAMNPRFSLTDAPAARELLAKLAPEAKPR